MFSLLKLQNPLITSSTDLFGGVLKSFYSNKLSAREKNALFKSVCIIQKNPECYGLSFFKELFKKCPDYAKFFSKYGKCPEEILKNECFVTQHVNNKFMKSIFEFVTKLDDPCDADQFMKKIGKKHVKHCITEEHFENATEILLKSLEFNLADKWNCEVEQGWKKATKIMLSGLNKGLKAKKKD